MKTTPIFLFSILLLGACGGPAARAKRPGAKAQAAAAVQAEPKTYTYRIAATYPHSTGAYTQGLQYVDGTMWEGTGQHGESVVRKTDLATGKTEVMARLPRSEFGEGITLLGGKLYQLTWQSNTTDGEKLYMSDGTATIHTVDPATFRREKRVTVTYKGAPVEYLNELEWIGGKIWANVYTTDQIVVIDPATGVVEGVVDLAGLLPETEMTATTDVLNGIAYDAEGDRIFVTGKNWPKLYEIEITEK